jgi:predicted RNase H-like nuclease (RuvC/YqgF family)
MKYVNEYNDLINKRKKDITDIESKIPELEIEIRSLEAEINFYNACASKVDQRRYSYLSNETSNKLVKKNNDLRTAKANIKTLSNEIIILNELVENN